MTYRTGNHWGVTIVRETDLGPAATSAQLVAVVVNGDQALAERICALLNGSQALDDSDGFCSGHTPDVDHTRGAAEALAAIRRRLTHDGVLYPGDAMLLQDVAAELGVDGDAPSSPLSAPLAAQEAPVGGSGRPGGVETLSGDPAITPDRRCRKCGAAVESVTAEPHTEAPHSSGLYTVAMSIARTLHPCGHGYIQATGAEI